MATFFSVIQQIVTHRLIYVFGVLSVLLVWGGFVGFGEWTALPSPAYPLNVPEETQFQLEPGDSYRLLFRSVENQLAILHFRFEVEHEAQGEVQIEIGQAGSPNQQVTLPVSVLREKPQLDVSLESEKMRRDRLISVTFETTEPGVYIWVRPGASLWESPFSIGWFVDGERQPVVPLFRPQFKEHSETIWEADVKGFRHLLTERWERLHVSKPVWVVWGMVISGVGLVVVMMIGLRQWFEVIVPERGQIPWQVWFAWWVVVLSGFWFMGG